MILDLPIIFIFLLQFAVSSCLQTGTNLMVHVRLQQRICKSIIDLIY